MHRRSALVRHVKLAVASELKVGKAPEEGGEGTMAEWRERCVASWYSAKVEAKAKGLLYPEFVTKLLMHHAESADPYVDHLDPFVVSENDNDNSDAAHLYASLEVMEAYWLLIIALSFEALLVQDPSAGQCSKNSITDAHIVVSRMVVRKQRQSYQERARDRELLDVGEE